MPSENGWEYDFLIVGAKPTTFMKVKIITATSALELKYHANNDTIAINKNIQSIFVMLESDFLKYARKAIAVTRVPEAPMTHAPKPPLSDN